VPIDWTEYFTEDELDCQSVIKFGFTANKLHRIISNWNTRVSWHSYP